MSTIPAKRSHARLPVEDVLQQHVDTASTLSVTRRGLVTAPHVRLPDLRSLDERLAAHLDGVFVAGEAGWSYCDEAFESAPRGAAFVAAVKAIQERHRHRLERLYALGEALPDACGGLLSAFAWCGREQLQGIVLELLASNSSSRRRLGVAICGVHRVDPGLASDPALHSDVDVRQAALRTAGQIGLREFDDLCAKAIQGDDDDCRFWGAWSSVLLGDRQNGLTALAGAAVRPGTHQPRALSLVLQAKTPPSAHALLKQLAADPSQRPQLVQGTGIAGDVRYIPWLIDQMRKPALARVAGEAFSLVTGIDLAANRLDRPQPEDTNVGPNDNPDDDNVDMDPDEGLPWPDVAKVDAWWAANAARFPPGQRYFMGAPVTREHCIHVLKTGYQRQRILAAQYLCLLEPGTPLFNTSAPAWRQQRQLARM